MIKRILIKITSSKFIVAIWSMIMATYMITHNNGDSTTCVLLISLTGAYCGLNVLQHVANGKK